jgi:hypothetical protein
MHWLLVGCGRKGLADIHLQPFAMYRGALRRRLGLTWQRYDADSLDAVRAIVREHGAGASPADAVLVMVPFHHEEGEVVELMAELRELCAGRKLVFLDYYAQSSSPYFGVLPYVDAYAKRQVLRDFDRYQDDSPSGYIFTDYLQQQMGWDVHGWRFGSKPDPALVDKLVLSWNIGVNWRTRLLLWRSRLTAPRWEKRPIGFNNRLGLPMKAQDREWYQEYREFAGEAARKLDGRVHTSGDARVSFREYARELRRSKSVFSPFGWGEVCYRDYEAACAGALVVKPSVEHLKTSPNLFRENAYVSVAWDFSDLEERTVEVLEDAERAKATAQRGRQIMWDYLEGGGFVEDVDRLNKALNHS